jgi:hypothetical protein
MNAIKKKKPYERRISIGANTEKLQKKKTEKPKCRQAVKAVTFFQQ